MSVSSNMEALRLSSRSYKTLSLPGYIYSFFGVTAVNVGVRHRNSSLNLVGKFRIFFYCLILCLGKDNKTEEPNFSSLFFFFFFGATFFFLAVVDRKERLTLLSPTHPSLLTFYNVVPPWMEVATPRTGRHKAKLLLSLITTLKIHTFQSLFSVQHVFRGKMDTK